MPRPISKGLQYFNLDITFFQDRKVRKLQRNYGGNAPLIYIALLSAIYTEGYYVKLDEDLIFDLADTTRLEEADVERVINGCVEIGLLSKDLYVKYGVLTSFGIQKRYEKICETCKRQSHVEQYSLLKTDVNNEPIEGVSSEETLENEPNLGVSSEETPENGEKGLNSGVSSEFSAQSKVKKSKVKKSKENSSSSEVPSSDEEREEEKEKIISFFTFSQNFVNPNAEYERMVSYNSTPTRQKKWCDMTRAEHEACAALWHPEGETVKDHKQRFEDSFRKMWQAVYAKICERGAPTEVRMAALDDGVNYRTANNTLVLKIPLPLYKWIEEPENEGDEFNLDCVKPVFLAFMREKGCNLLAYDKT